MKTNVKIPAPSRWRRLAPQSVRATWLATIAHRGQTDLDGKRYAEHLRRVSRRTDTADESTVAWLHDTIEDTPVTEADLRAHGFSDRVVEAVLAITHWPGQDDAEYVEQVLANELAVTVKQYDLLDHLETGRGARGRYGNTDWFPPTVMVGHPKLPFYIDFLGRIDQQLDASDVPLERGRHSGT